MKISLCIIALNEEKNLERCLKSAAGLVHEIIIVDSGSTDGTKLVAENFSARFVTQPWMGYGNQKNFALSLAAHDWVLSLDADEALSPRLREEISLLKEPDASISGYSMPRCVFFEGKWIRHGDWYPDRLVRLFRRDRAEFAGGRVHERLELDGDILQLKNDLEHYSFRDAADHEARGEKYARLWAETQAEQGRKVSALAPISRAVFKLLRGYVLRGGFLDGRIGWGIAWRNAREVYRKYKLLRGFGDRFPSLDRSDRTDRSDD